MTSFQRPQRGRVPISLAIAPRIRQKSLQKSGHFVEYTLQWGQGSFAKTGSAIGTAAG